MDADDILEWSKQYDDGYPQEHKTIEENLHESLTEQQFITQDQLAKVIRWKLDNQPGRRDRFTKDMRNVPDEFVRLVSEAALLIDDPKRQLHTLDSIPGVGGAMATVVLAFYDPTNHVVGDRYIVDALFGEDRQMQFSDYPKILAEFRQRNPGDFTVRTIEKAYYQRYREENDII
jgi:hypothetical protein